MLNELQFTDARKNFTTMYNEVFNSYKPMIIKRKQTEEVLLLRTDLQKMLLSNFTLKPEILHENDGSITLALDTLEIFVNGETLEKAFLELVQDLKYYAQDYVDRSHLFLNAPNRRPHFPYVLRILLCKNDEEIRSLLEI